MNSECTMNFVSKYFKLNLINAYRNQGELTKLTFWTIKHGAAYKTQTLKVNSLIELTTIAL